MCYFLSDETLQWFLILEAQCEFTEAHRLSFIPVCICNSWKHQRVLKLQPCWQENNNHERKPFSAEGKYCSGLWITSLVLLRNFWKKKKRFNHSLISSYMWSVLFFYAYMYIYVHIFISFQLKAEPQLGRDPSKMNQSFPLLLPPSWWPG